MKKRKPVRIYRYLGQIERVQGRRGRVGTYKWHDGFQLAIDERGIQVPDPARLYPWMTRKECREEAAAAGCIAEFVYPDRGVKHGA